uniref:glycosyltransferase family 4 protein n=1 Tax=Streptococcus pluranimalium TaxID=82348 RepID=UPI003F68EE1C
MKPKILIFNGYYYPAKKTGGPITSIENAVNACSDEYDFYVIAYNHDFADQEEFNVPLNQWVTYGKAKVMYVKNNDIDFSFSRNKQILEELLPDLIWFSGVLTPNNKIVTSINARKLCIPVLFSPRGEVSDDRVAIKRIKKIPYLKLLQFFRIYKNSYFHGTSEDEISGIKRFFTSSDSHIFNIPNIPVQKQDTVNTVMKEEQKLRIIFFSRIHEVKNLDYAIKVLNNCKEQITFDIYGPIESVEYWEECQKLIEGSPANILINYQGLLERENMSQIIQSYDLLFFPTVNENYGHVIAESLANSVPVLLSRGTTPWDDLDNCAGFTFNLENPDEFSGCIDKLAKMSYEDFSILKQQTYDYFDKKIEQDEAIHGHKNMFKKIINSKEIANAK